MLPRPETFHCIECGTSSLSPTFIWYYGDLEQGPAYWSDRGVLCSPACSLAHHRKRGEDGSLAQHPAPDIYS